MISKKLKSFNGHVGYKILRSRSPQEFFIVLAIGLLLKSNTVCALDHAKGVLQTWIIIQSPAILM